ncbi:Cysteine/serine-rich nuclear protein 2 [Schistosoma japonicum]|nr:Cysteine/serine-rich nuclear protein 2 [Schistosoma japonicum]KAH8857133.1 Cysteine/serine-rich nuclear protein 2 [Schistosoma japonicum]KAH8857134.1 Cysteine/serine-rich nuclear protein 2 [Schistosoma japonicum]
MCNAVDSDCWSGSMVGFNETVASNDETAVLSKSQIHHETYSLPVQPSGTCSTTPQVPPNCRLSCLRVCSADEEASQNKSSRSKSIRFSGVTVYSFARQQGFSSIPDSGWCTLGMAQKHFSVSRMDLQQYRLLQKLRRRQRRLLSQKSRFASNISARERGRSKIKAKSKRTNGLCSRSPGDSCRVPMVSSPPPLSPQVTFDRFPFIDPSDNTVLNSHATPPPPCLSPPSPRRFIHSLDDSLVNSNICNSLDSLDTDSEASLDHIPSSKSSQYRQNNTREKLMPVHSTARIRLLRSSGVAEIDESERLVCSFVRAMRSRVGCNCGPNDLCTPGQCSCADEEIPCQVDRASFPCSCTANGCRNPNGRNEFSREQVRAHTQHVLSRLTDNSTVHPIESPWDSSVSGTAILSTPNGTCSLCLDNSKTMKTTQSNPIVFLGNSHSELVQHMQPLSNSQFLPSPSNATLLHINNCISPIATTRQNHSPSSTLLKESSLISDNDNNHGSQVLQSFFIPSANFPTSPLVIDLTLSSDDEPQNKSPKSTPVRTQSVGDEQTPLNKQTSQLFSPQTSTNCFSPDDCIIIDNIEKSESSFVNEISISPLPDILIIDENKNSVVDESLSDSQSVTKSIVQRRRSRSADAIVAHDCDNFPIKINGNHCSQNVDSILGCILSEGSSVPYDVNKCSTTVAQLSTVSTSFNEYMRTNTLWPVTYLKNDNNKDCFVSRSAPNSPCTQKNDVPYGRISLRRRAIPRIPVTPTRRAITHSNRLQLFNSASTSGNKVNLQPTLQSLSTPITHSCHIDITSDVIHSPVH